MNPFRHTEDWTPHMRLDLQAGTVQWHRHPPPDSWISLKHTESYDLDGTTVTGIETRCDVSWDRPWWAGFKRLLRAVWRAL